MFARYSLIGALSAAFGALAAAFPQYLSAAGIGQLAAIKAMFVLYALLGVAGCLLYARIPRLPADGRTEPAAPSGRRDTSSTSSRRCSAWTAFAGGFVVQSLLALWLFERFDLSLSAASLFFFWSGVLSRLFLPGRGVAVAAHRPDQHDGVHAYPVEHLPDPGGVRAEPSRVALALLLVRAALSQMDVPTRSSYVMAVVTAAERPAAASFTSVPRSLAAAASPALAGALFAASFQAGRS